MLLTDPVDLASRELLVLLHRGSGHGSGEWPVWQWVLNQAAQQGWSAETALRGLPEWQDHYRPVAGSPRGIAPRLADRLSLTVHGLTQVEDDLLLPAFLTALNVATEAAVDHVTTPHEVRPLVLDGRDLLATVRARCGFRGTETQLRGLLEREPATWSSHSDDGRSDSWSWDITQLNLLRFVQVRTAPDYLQQLELLVGVPQPAAAPGAPLPPLALLEALEHLDAHWRLRTGRRLLASRRLEAVATLALPVTSAAELQSAHSALADLLAGLDPDGPPSDRQGALNQLEAQLVVVVDHDRLPRAQAAIGTLRQLAHLRADYQHSGSRAFRRGQAARAGLGLSPMPGAPNEEWEIARQACVEALRGLRTAIAVSGDLTHH